jgi:purine nucleosidase
MTLIGSQTRALLIDTDTASDDAVALIMALRSSVVEVKAITIVAGNVPAAQGTQNALFTAELCGSDVPVFCGQERPLRRPLQIADWFHGEDGLGNHGYRPVKKTAEREHAVSALIRVVRANPGIEIITLGPLTNLATALLQSPDLVKNVSRCVVMGGAPCTEGNVTPAAEFNIWVDPEAAQIVFRSGLPIEMIGWQLSRGEAVVNEREIEKIAALGTPFANFAIDSNCVAREAYRRQTAEVGISLPDPVAMSILLDPSLALEASCHFVEIEVQSELTRGMTVVDRLRVTHDLRNQEIWSAALARNAPASVCWKLDVPGWKQALFTALT